MSQVLVYLRNVPVVLEDWEIGSIVNTLIYDLLLVKFIERETDAVLTLC